MEPSKLVFVSYAHKDEHFLKKEVMPFLRQLELGDQIELWHDRLIGIGEDWYAEIAGRLEEAKVAILLVTPAFLASRFCLHEEVPVLLQRARQGRLHLMPLLAKPCFWDNELWLSRPQMWPQDAKALSKHGKADRQEVMAEFARRLLKVVEAPLEAAGDEVRVDAPDETHDISRLPQTGSLLFGRRKEIKLLDEAWDLGTNLIAFTAGGGVGKSTLVRVWAERLAEEGWRGAERVYAWSFYSQGTGRMTDAESFIEEALLWFGGETGEGLSLWERGERLAELVRRHRTLLLLDGVEPLQAGRGDIDQGSIRDPGLRTLLEELARKNTGLCVVTTRERLTDLGAHGESAVVHRDLDQVSPLAGRALLRVARVRGEDVELEAVVEELGRHALAVSLLASLLADGSDRPHISSAKALPPLEYAVEEGGHPRRVLRAWEKRLGESAALELLHILGLFDRPAPLGAVGAVLGAEMPLRGLSRHLKTEGLESPLRRLRAAGLVARASRHTDTIDAHPVVREHFGALLEKKHAKSHREGHRLLYEYYKDAADNQPSTLREMEPLFAAVRHGCQAGLHHEARREVYRRRILHGNEFYLTQKLGAFAADLSCLSHFFAARWMEPHPSLSSPAQAWVLSVAGLDLRALGRFREAASPQEEALRRSVAAEDWANAAKSASNLSELYLTLGNLEEADARARDATGYADKSGDASQRMRMRAVHADVLHQLGRVDEARALFREAERIQVEDQSMYPFLYSLQGYWYCDLLLSEGKAAEVLRRAKLFFEWRVPSDSLLTIALEHLILGRAHMATSPPNLEAAEEHLRRAVSGLRAAGAAEFLALGLLSRSAFYLSQGSQEEAWYDLEEVRTLVARTGMRRFEGDLALEQTRWRLQRGETLEARHALEKAQALIIAMGYLRRQPEAEALESRIAAMD